MLLRAALQSRLILYIGRNPASV